MTFAWKGEGVGPKVEGFASVAITRGSAEGGIQNPYNFADVMYG